MQQVDGPVAGSVTGTENHTAARWRWCTGIGWCHWRWARWTFSGWRWTQSQRPNRQFLKKLSSSWRTGKGLHLSRRRDFHARRCITCITALHCTAFQKRPERWKSDMAPSSPELKLVENLWVLLKQQNYVEVKLYTSLKSVQELLPNNYPHTHSHIFPFLNIQFWLKIILLDWPRSL